MRSVLDGIDDSCEIVHVDGAVIGCHALLRSTEQEELRILKILLTISPKLSKCVSVLVFSRDPGHNLPQVVNILEKKTLSQYILTYFHSIITFSKLILESAAATEQKRSWVHCSS